MSNDSIMYIDIEGARKLCTKIFINAGATKKDADVVVDNLIQADLRGIASHGISRMMVYSERIVHNNINIHPDIKIIKESPATLLLDADNGLGAVAGIKAMDMCIKKASKSGIAACTVKNANHYGIGSYYAMRALSYDMIGIALTNAPVTMAIWGGMKPMIGTNPFCIAIPAEKKLPIVLDVSSSIVARGKITLCQIENKPIPEGWAVDSKGRPTTDPTEALKGSVLPFGGYKGSGIAIVVDILCGLLSGADFGSYIGVLYDKSCKAQNLGYYFSAIKISNFVDPKKFKKRMDQMIDEIKNSEKAEGVKEIFVPGELEFINEERNRKIGIEIGIGVLKDLKILKEKFRVDINPEDYITMIK